MIQPPQTASTSAPADPPTTADGVALRPADPGDLDQINAVIARAIDTWPVSARIRRASVPLYRYHATDFQYLDMIVAVDADGRIVGVAAWEPAERQDLPGKQNGLLLHGIYVDPDWHHRGIGSRLLDRAVDAARQQHYDGVLVKAQAQAITFFRARGLRTIPVADAARDYPHRLWHPTGTDG